MSESPSSETAEPGRIISHTTPVNRTGWIRWFPGLDTLRHYKSSWLRHDFVAGLVMTTMLVPVGIAYAQASGVPGINAFTRLLSRCSHTLCLVQAAFLSWALTLRSRR